MHQLFEFDDVTAAILLDREGLVIASMHADGRDQMHAAYVAAAFTSIDRYTREAVAGPIRQLLITTDRTLLVVTETAHNNLLLVEASIDVNIGRIRLDSLRTAADL